MRKYLISLAAAILVFFILAYLLVLFTHTRSHDTKTYNIQFIDTKKILVAGTYEVLNIIAGISQAWSNALYAGSDPKRSVELYSKLISDNLKSLERQSTIIEIQIRGLKKKYPEFKNSSRILDDLYGIRARLINVSLKPPETLREFTAQTNELTSQFMEKLIPPERALDTGSRPEDMSAQYDLTGLFYNPNGPSSAIINGLIANEGDIQSNIHVIKINRQSVDILVAGKKGFLKVP